VVIYKLARILTENKPDIVQTWMYHADLLGGLIARMVGINKVLWGIHSIGIPQGPLSITYWVVRLCAALSYFIPHRIICCANSARSAHIKLHYCKEKLIVINNGYDFSRFVISSKSRSEIRNSLNISPDDIVIGAVGRFDPLKDYHNFVSAASLIAQKREDVKFLMLGANIDWGNATLCSWIDQYHIRDRFRLIGFSADVPLYLSSLDIFCLSSRMEAFPNVVVEAMAMGLPCIVTRAGDAGDIVGSSDYSVPVGDSEALASALLRMCSTDVEKRVEIGKINAEKVRRQYDVKIIRDRYLGVYRGELS
jgi:glycosyltransferase involved in cell wall biosynthesis